MLSEQVSLVAALIGELGLGLSGYDDLTSLTVSKVPTALLIGQRDRTVIGRDLVSDELAQRMGDYPSLGKTTAKRIPDARPIELEGVSHMPHIEAPERYLEALRSVVE